MNTIVQPETSIPIIEECDLCVVGGSCTGVFAAVRAARLGLKVAIVEKQNCFGGTATAGLVYVWSKFFDDRGDNQVIAGLSQEVIERLHKRNEVFVKDGHLPKSYKGVYRFNSEELKIELDMLIRESDISPYLHTHFVSAIAGDDGAVDAVVISNKDGLNAIKAKVFVDASGDGDLLRSSGCRSYVNEVIQAPTMCSKVYGMDTLGDVDWKKLIDTHHAEFDLPADRGWGTLIYTMPKLTFLAQTHVFNVNCGKGSDLTYAEMEGRRHVRAFMDLLRKYGPEETDLNLACLPSTIGLRDSYHIECRHQVTEDEILTAKAFDDAIGYGTYPVDIHYNDRPGLILKFLNGTSREFLSNTEIVESTWGQVKPDYKPYYEIPFSALQPKHVNNVLAAGRMLDADMGAFGALRLMVNANQMGEAVGTAAYVMLDEGSDVQTVDVQRVRAELKKGGSIIIEA